MQETTHTPYWADKFAQEIRESNQYRPYWVDDMKTPSGRVHIGSVRAVLSHALIHRALVDAGEAAEFSYVLEDQDPMDKVPAYLSVEEWKEHVGKPLYLVPSPEDGYTSYGHRWGQEYIEIFNLIGAHPKIIWGSELYISGKMDHYIELCLNKREKIAEIYAELYEQEKPNDWYPFNPRCENCNKILSTRITSWDGTMIDYVCDVETTKHVTSCGHEGRMSPFGGNGKLPWKVEWPCKWQAIGVTVEGAGKDHMSDGGSHDFAKIMCKNVLECEVPFSFAHEFFLVGGRKMSSSKGVGSSAKEISQIVPPHIMRYLIVRTRYNRAINFDPNNMMIPDAFDEYDEAAREFWKEGGDPLKSRIYELSQVDNNTPTQHFLPRFRDVAIWMQHPEIDLQQQFESVKGNALTKQELTLLEERKKFAKIWVDDYAPREFQLTPSENLPPEAQALTNEQKEFVITVFEMVKGSRFEPQQLQQKIYDLARAGIGTKDGFQALYTALIGQGSGPRAAWLILNTDAGLLSERIEQLKNKNLPSLAVPKDVGTQELVQPEVRKAFPGIHFAYLTIENVSISDHDDDLEKLKNQVVSARSQIKIEDIAEMKAIQQYRSMLKATGTNPTKKRPSPEALLRRVIKGKGLYTINTAVDAYNLAVIETSIGLGGFDKDMLQHDQTLRFSSEGEEMLLHGDDQATRTREGQLVYSDGDKPTTIDLNYRDITETGVTLQTQNVLLVADGAPGVDVGETIAALQKAASYIQEFCGGEISEVVVGI